MRKIIKNRVYDSDTAKKITIRFIGPEFQRSGWEELYQKKNGEYFILHHSYQERIERITPVSYEEAQQWATDYLPALEAEEIFGEVSEGEEIAHMHISMKKQDSEAIRRAAAKAGLTVSEYIVKQCKLVQD